MSVRYVMLYLLGLAITLNSAKTVSRKEQKYKEENGGGIINLAKPKNILREWCYANNITEDQLVQLMKDEKKALRKMARKIKKVPETVRMYS